MQDAVLRALAAAAQFRPGTSVRAWLFTILRNGFFEQARRRRIERRVLSHAGPGDAIVAASQQGNIELADLSRHLFALSPLLREALVLVGAQGLDYEEAAAICGVPVGTMKARVSRARGQLAKVMTSSRTAPEPPAL